MFWSIVGGCSASFKNIAQGVWSNGLSNYNKDKYSLGGRQKTKSFGRFSSTADDEVRKIIAMLNFFACTILHSIHILMAESPDFPTPVVHMVSYVFVTIASHGILNVESQVCAEKNNFRECG